MDVDFTAVTSTGVHTQVGQSKSKLFNIPDEIVLLILAALDTRDVLSFSVALPSIKDMVNSHDFIRTRELRCFCLKESFLETKLGVGVAVVQQGKRSVFRFEFYFLS